MRRSWIRRLAGFAVLAVGPISVGASAQQVPATPAPDSAKPALPTPPSDTAHPTAATPSTPATNPLQPAPPSPHRESATVRLAFTGDVNLGTSTLPDGVPRDDGRGLLAAAHPELTGDLVVGNLEGVLADSGTSTKCRPPAPPPSRARRHRRARVPRPPVTPPIPCYAFLTPTQLAPRLKDAGFTHLNLANNHANDYGPAGRASTEAVLQQLGLTHYGPVGQIVLDSVRRGDSLTTVALIGFTTYSHSYDLLDIVRSAVVVDSMRRLADLVVVTFHGGSEGLAATHVPEAAESLGKEPRGDLRRWARAVIDAGADVVVGHGPHVLRGMEFYRGKLIAYSLGNFLTYRGFNLTGPLGVTGVLQLEFAPDRSLRRARLIPMRQIPGQGVVPDPDNTAITLIRRLSTEDFGPTAAQVTPDGLISPP
jgi:hypothetical protein